MALVISGCSPVCRYCTLCFSFGHSPWNQHPNSYFAPMLSPDFPPSLPTFIFLAFLLLLLFHSSFYNPTWLAVPHSLLYSNPLPSRAQPLAFSYTGLTLLHTGQGMPRCVNWVVTVKARQYEPATHLRPSTQTCAINNSLFLSISGFIIDTFYLCLPHNHFQQSMNLLEICKNPHTNMENKYIHLK